MLTRWRPFGDVQAEMNRLHDEMNRLFRRWGSGSRTLAHGSYPPLNLWEDEANLYVETELPGFELDDLNISVLGNNQLSIDGERTPPEVESGVWHRQERGYGKFSRAVELPAAVDAKKVSAEFKFGVLTITLPKRQEAKPRRIEVQVN